MGFDLIIRNGFIVNETSTIKADIAVSNGTVVQISQTPIVSDGGEDIVDGSGLYIFPGLVDTHVHLNEPGRTEWEGIETGTHSLAAGGITTYFDMPLNSYPPTSNAKAYRMKEELAKEKSRIDFRLWGALVPGNIDQLESLHECGAIGFKAFMSRSGTDDFRSSDDQTLFAGMKKISELGAILAVHAESDIITHELTQEAIRNGEGTAASYSGARPIEAEIEAVQRILSYAKVTQCKIHIVHVSSRKVIRLVEQAKDQGIDVTVETCPHYLSLTIDDMEQLGTIAKCAPPLRDTEERENLWKSFQNGEIDIIGSDHSPAPFEMKKRSIFESWGGISGAQSTLNVLLEEGYFKRGVSLESIVKTVSSNPAKRFGIYPRKGMIATGSDADFVIVDLNESFVLERGDLLYRHPFSPYVGKRFRGKVVSTYVGGNKVYDGRKLPQINS